MKKRNCLFAVVLVFISLSCTNNSDAIQMMEEAQELKFKKSQSSDTDTGWCEFTTMTNHEFDSSIQWKKGKYPIAWEYDMQMSCGSFMPCPVIPISYNIELQTASKDEEGNFQWGEKYELSYWHTSADGSKVVFDIDFDEIGGESPKKSRYRIKFKCSEEWTDWIESKD